MASSAGPVRRGPYPELTLPAVLVGYLLGILITVSIGYASLVLGFSIEGSELAAILGWGVLRGIMRRTSIVENNINQTIASAVNGASAGMMFSVPALFNLNAKTPGLIDFNPYLMVFACAAGGVLGIAFIVPLRKQMIDFSRLAYPGGIAVAAILKSPGAGTKKAMLLLGGAAVSAIAHFAVTQVLAVPHETAHVAAVFGLRVPPYMNVAFYLSLLTVGVGFLSGKGGLVFGLGGFICYWVLAPMIDLVGPAEMQPLIEWVPRAKPFVPFVVQGLPGVEVDLPVIPPDGGPGTLRGLLFMPAGIGILVGAAIGGVIAAFPLIQSAIRSMQEAGKVKQAGAPAVEEMPISVLYAGIAIAFVGLSSIAYLVAPDIGVWRAVAMALLGTRWIWIAGVIPPTFISLRLIPATPAAPSCSMSSRVCTDSSATTGMEVCFCTSPISLSCSRASGCSISSMSYFSSHAR